MNSTDSFNASTLREFAHTEGPCITLVVHGQATGNEITALRSELSDRGIDPDALLGPVADALGAEGRKGSMAILRAPSLMQIFEVDESVPAGAHVGDRFDLRTLLNMGNARKRFYILALSRNRTRLLKCTERSSEEVPFPAGVAVSLADDRQTRQPDHVLDNRASGGPSTGHMKGVMFGTSTDREDRDEFLLHFFRDIDRAVNSMLKDSSDRLVPVAVEQELALFKTVNTYKYTLEPGVHGAPDGLEGGEMHKRALELLDETEREFGTIVPADFDKRVGTGHASAHIQEIVAGAWEGRVSHLFLRPDASYSGVFDDVRQVVKHTSDPLDHPQDLIDAAAWQTILHGGEVRMAPGSALPNGVPVCALFRYPVAAQDAA